MEPHGPADTGMVEESKIDPALLSAGETVARAHNYFTDETGTLISGVWDCTAMTTKLAPYAVNELMIVLEGSVTVIGQDILSQQLTVKTEDGRRILIHGDDVLSITRRGEDQPRSRRGKGRKNKTSPGANDS